MNNINFIPFFISFFTVLLVTPFVIKFAIWVGATDKPNERKVHQKVMPRLGGLAVFLGCIAGYFSSGLYNEKVSAISLGALIIVLIGMLDDKYQLSARWKFIGQLLVAILIVSSGLLIEFIKIPGVISIDLGIWAYPLTIFWIVAVTNAINLIDGLDGLATGVSLIAISTITLLAAMNGNVLIITIGLILIGSCIGFLFYNFNPAKIFLGDTGSLFIGYSISILSLLGLYKSVTLFSFIVPIIILGVPVFDTTFAIIRRLVNKRPISSPDKGHLHHQLLSLGLSHRKTVLAIYGLSTIFGLAAILFSRITLWSSLFLLIILVILLEIIAELIGLVNNRYKPVLKLYKKMSRRNS
jgi:UDP-GlcNAc:undecaprenyl-phosphate/decaprenyl-phosphate GlcNAc-1-phosphate transferase